MESIAIIGISLNFPGAQTLDQFWENLTQGTESISFCDRAELVKRGVLSELLDNDRFVLGRGELSEDYIKGFDAAFFDISNKEAVIVDPQQRIFLKCAWSALEDAGCEPRSYCGRIGVYAGSGYNQYVHKHLLSNSAVNCYDTDEILLANDVSHLATRVAYKLGLTGPALTVQTAGSTSLVALHQACLSLHANDCDIALCGAVSLGDLDAIGYVYEKGKRLSPDGHCRPYDDEALGTVISQGVAAVVLKRTSVAQRDGDHIYAIIKASAINNDGNTKEKYTASSVIKQTEVVQAAHAKSNVDLRTITYIEGQGTGNASSDFIELQALKHAFEGTTYDKQYCALGSVKSNIGDLDAAAGMASLIKTTLMLKYRQIPATLNCLNPASCFDFLNSPFFINIKTQEWSTPLNLPRRAGVSSFGIGGTNVHIILEEYVDSNRIGSPSCEETYLIPLSARTKKALDSTAAQLSIYLRKHDDEISIIDVAHTLQVGRYGFQHRQIVACHSVPEAADLLPVATQQVVNFEYSVVFVFSGQTKRNITDIKHLYQQHTVFYKEMNDCLEILQLTFPEIHFKFNVENEAASVFLTCILEDDNVSQLEHFMMEYALAKLWMSIGIKPNIVLGHSLGEYVAACIASVMNLTDALFILVTHALLIQTMLPSGSMLTIRADENKTKEYLLTHISVDIAAVNASDQCVVAGNVASLETLMKDLDRDGVSYKLLEAPHAYHSRYMLIMTDEFRKRLSKCQFATPQIRLISTVSGNYVNEPLDADHWCRHLCQPVEFSRAIQALCLENQYHFLLLEIGPGSVLKNLIVRQELGPRIKPVATLDNHYSLKSSKFLAAVAQLWLAGISVDWISMYPGGRRVSLPTYPFEDDQHYWIYPAGTIVSNASLSTSHDGKIEYSLSGVNGEEKPDYDEISIEFRMLQLWRSFFKKRDIGLNATYDELGGDSMMAIKLIDLINREFDVDCSVALLTEYNTSQKLACYIKQRVSMDKMTSNIITSTYQLIQLQQGAKDKIPLILIHPLGGMLTAYQKLVESMEKTQPIFGFQVQSIFNRTEPYASITHMAADYVAALEERFGSRPCVLAGYSFGGLVAFEMTHQLHKQNHKLSLPVLFDSSPPGIDVFSNTTNINAAVLFGIFGNKMAISKEELIACSNLMEQIDFLYEKAQKTGYTGLPVDKEMIHVMIHTWKTHRKAVLDYSGNSLNCDVLFFRATETAGVPANHDLGWRDLVSGKFMVCPISATHGTLLQGSAVKQIADRLISEIKMEEIKLSIIDSENSSQEK